MAYAPMLLTPYTQQLCQREYDMKALRLLHEQSSAWDSWNEHNPLQRDNNRLDYSTKFQVIGNVWLSSV